MEIINATTKDLNEIVELGTKTYIQHFSNIWTQSGLNEYLKYHFDKETIKSSIENETAQYLLVSNSFGSFVGYAKINWDVNIPFSQYRGAELQKIYFLENYTGKGLGTLLLNHCINLAKERNDKYIWLDVLKSNLKAMKLYEKHNFLQYAEDEVRTDKGKIGIVLMKRELKSN
jgi:ribosomal protein S18 acetylase RimI-like enzyme